MTRSANRTIANGRLLDAIEVVRHIADRADASAPNVDLAVSHLAYELVVLGFPSSGGGEKVHTSGTSDPTSQQADLSWLLTSTREDLRDAISAFGEWARAGGDHMDVLTLAINNARGIRVSKAERDEAEAERRKLNMTVCCDMLHGKDGAHEWGDALCSRPSVKAGLCTTHYYAWYRWRIANGIETARDHEPAA